MSKKGSIDNPIELSSSPVKTKATEVIMVDDDSDSEENELGLEPKNASQPKKPLKML